MIRVLGQTFLRAAAAAWVLVVFLSVGAAPAFAALAGSRHDWTNGPSPNGLPKNGPCSACHIPHYSADKGLWSRSLAEENAHFAQTATPNYVPLGTVLCFDCHDDNAIHPENDPEKPVCQTPYVPYVDNDPPGDTWLLDNTPENIAFTDCVPPSPETTTSQTGYYEVADGKVPVVGNLPTAGEKTGGHYWKSDPDPNGTPAFVKGDKIFCALCHDPHNARTGTNEAMFLTQTVDGAGGTVDLGAEQKLASGNTRNGTGTGREMCAACHGYYDAGSQKTFWGVTVPQPPSKIRQHWESNDAACTNCHRHNGIPASCDDCHGFPPILASTEAGGYFVRGDPVRKKAENYDGGSGAHGRHMAVLGETVFQCELCHGPDPGGAPWHFQGDLEFTDSGLQVNMIGTNAYWKNPLDPAPHSPTYDGTAATDPKDPAYPSAELVDYAFSRKGGGTMSCVDFACHGYPPTANLLWPGKSVCEWCHDATPAVLGAATPSSVPNVMTYWRGSIAGRQDGGHGDPDGRDQVLPHQPPVCTDCHDTSIPMGTHANGTYSSLWDDTTRNENTAHLKAEFFSRTAPPALPMGSPAAWDVQVTFDNYCAYKCHRDTTNWVTAAVPDMRHEADTFGPDGSEDPVDAAGTYTHVDDSSNHWSVEYGTHLTVANGDSQRNGKKYPVDTDLNTAAAGAKYAACVTCHDPHGTGTTEPTRASNRMVRDKWIAALAPLCNACHE